MPAKTDSRQLQFTGLIAVVAVLLAAGVYLVVQPAGHTLTAYFSSTAALFEDNDVRVLGVPVGSITKVVPEGDKVRVEMQLNDPDLKLPADAKAVVISPSLVTGRYVQLTPTYATGPELPDRAVIPIERTAVPLGVDDLTRTATDLAKALGPKGANSTGAVSDFLEVGADNLAGNGQAVNNTIHNLGELSGTLAASREDLFGTITQLQSFVSTIKANDAEVREFNTRLEDVAGFLASEKGNLAAAVSELSIALGDVADFIRDNRAALKGNVDKLTDVTAVLVKQRNALAETFDVAPAALSNLYNTYNASSGTLDTRANINELTMPPIVMVCALIQRSAPQGLPKALTDSCAEVAPILSGVVPLPSAAQVVTALTAGQPPPVPGLALPTLPALQAGGGR